LPVLQQHGFTATVFVTTGWLHDAVQPKLGGPPDRMLTWAQLRELSSAGIEIGGHSHSHAELDQLSTPAVRNELSDSRHILQDGLGHQIHSFAYPFGYCSRRVKSLAAESGYRQAAAVGNTIDSARDPFRVPRLTIRRSITQRVYARIVYQQWVRVHYARAHALTVGWYAVRRARSGMRQIARPGFHLHDRR
jgi:peptidoglycan/xylan/chitin deacetylase (PgdA/CDA1 family)